MRPCILVAAADAPQAALVLAALGDSHQVTRCENAILALKAATTGDAPALLAILAPLPGLAPVVLARAVRSAPGRAQLPVLLIGTDAAGLPPPVAACADADGIAAGLAALAAPATDSTDLLDPGVLAQLRAIPDLLPRVRDAFLGELDRRLADIDAAGDASALHRAAHTLKGGAAGVGARALSQAAAAVDRCARVGDLAGARAAFPALHALVAPTRAALERC